MNKFVLLIVLAIVLLTTTNLVYSKQSNDDKDCEICIEVIEGAKKLMTDKDMKTLEGIEGKIQKFCDQKELAQTTKKVCYFLEPVKREASRPLQNGVPPNKICSRLKAKSSEICGVRKKVKVEKGATDYSKMRIKELKKILSDRGVSCTNCLEKSEFVKKCESTEHLEL